eukprot:scaffold823_cov86-Cylindrotheca_fusiformis.AAC.4
MGANPLGVSMISSLTDQQEVVLSVLMVVSGTLSILGSSTIVYKVVRNRNKSKPYDRIMLGLSCFDIIASISCILTPFLLPAETSQRVWASGTEMSCSMLGWLTQLSFAALWYNCCLSYYFVATLKYNISASDFAARFEPYIHALTVFVFFFTATVGVPFRFYGEYRLGFGCWIAEYPDGCWTTGGCQGPLIAWFYGGIPLVFTFFSIPINNFILYWHVKSMLTEKSSRTPLQKAHIRRVATQGCLYVATFFVSFTPQFIIRILGSAGYDYSNEHEIYSLLVLNSLLLPLQGFFNMFVYTRPNYLRLKAAGASTLQALRGACFETDIPRLIDQSIRPQSVHHTPKPSPRANQPDRKPFQGHDTDEDDAELQLLSDAFECEEGSTSEDRGSGEDSQLPPLTPTSRKKKPISILKKSNKRTEMDGTITLS